LIPGLGTQGGSLEVANSCIDSQGGGAVFSVSRDITFPSQEEVKSYGLQGAIEKRTLSYLKLLS
jgi:hypothetical protein